MTADYYPLIARAVAGLPQNTIEARSVLYDRARDTLIAQLRGWTESDATRERDRLEQAIRKVEIEVGDTLHTAPSILSGRPDMTAPASRISLRGRKLALPVAIGLLATVLVIAIGIFAIAPRNAALDHVGARVPAADMRSPPSKPVPPPLSGQYLGSSNGDSISVKLVKADQGILIESVGHNFSGSGINVSSVSAKDGKPFGTYDGGILTFPIVFLVKFNPVNNVLTDSGGSIQASAYAGTVWLEDQKVHLTLVEGKADGFQPAISGIGFSTPADGFKMKERYDFDLSMK